MSKDTIVILGIPVDNLDMGETIERIFDMIDAYQNDGRARLVATVNVDFVVNTLAWSLQNMRHPELIDVLRKADLVTADGMPIVWTSRLMGTPLKERVTGADLVPALAGEASIRGKSIYFLGGMGDVGERAAALLKKDNPELNIAGIYSPFVHVEGESLYNSDEEDSEIIERINASKADILLIAFGNPKQEVWFSRNRDRLKVPVSIGIGGTFEFITGSVARAPLWMQKSGTEWIFRITQDPKRLWKRYVVGFFKFGIMIWPAILYYRYRRYLFALGPQPKAKPLQGGTDMAVFAMPGRIDAASLDGLGTKLDEIIEKNQNIVMNFGNVLFIDSSGLGFLIRKWRQTNEKGKKLYLVAVNRYVKHFLRLNRLWDVFQEMIYEDMSGISAEVKDQNKDRLFHYAIEDRGAHVLIEVTGRLDAAQMKKIDMEGIYRDLGEKNCIINLERMTFVDSTGLVFFLKIQKYLLNGGRVCVLCSLSDTVRQLFFITKLLPLFRVAPDRASAFTLLETPL